MTFCLSKISKRSIVELKIRTFTLTVRFMRRMPILHHIISPLHDSVKKKKNIVKMYHFGLHIAHIRVIFRLHVIRSTLYIFENAPPTRHTAHRTTGIHINTKSTGKYVLLWSRVYLYSLAYFSPPPFIRFHFIFHRRICDSLHVEWLFLHPQVHLKYHESVSSIRKAFDR